MILHVLTLLEQRSLTDQVNLRKVMQAVEEQNGLPVDITRGAAGADSLVLNAPSPSRGALLSYGLHLLKLNPDCGGRHSGPHFSSRRRLPGSINFPNFIKANLPAASIRPPAPPITPLPAWGERAGVRGDG
jgi:hypothetical protein